MKLNLIFFNYIYNLLSSPLKMNSQIDLQYTLYSDTLSWGNMGGYSSSEVFGSSLARA